MPNLERENDVEVIHLGERKRVGKVKGGMQQNDVRGVVLFENHAGSTTVEPLAGHGVHGRDVPAIQIRK